MKKTSIALLCTAALTLTACGGDKDEKADEPTRLTEAQFIDQANALCKASEKELDTLVEEAGVDSPASFKKFVEEVALDRMRKLVEDVEELEEPAALSDDVDAMLAAVSKEIDRAERNPMYLMGDDAFAEADKKARDLGLDVCGE